jgi:hypothetical protein
MSTTTQVKATSQKPSGSAPKKAQHPGGGARADNWVDRYVPESWQPYIQLARVNPPLAVLLIYFPHVFGAIYGGIVTRAPPEQTLKVLAILIRELAEAFDDRDSMYPRGMKHCARLVLEDCNALCDELRALVSPPLDQDGRPGERQPIGKAKIDQLQTEIDLQKAMLVATTALAGFTRQVIYTRYMLPDTLTALNTPA